MYPANLPSTLGDIPAPALGDPNATNPATIEIFGVGQPVDVNGYKITLTSAAFASGVLNANFYIDNTSPKEITISSMISFEAKDESGTKLEQAFMCGASLDGSVLPGDKLKGDICWKTGGATLIWLYYEPTAFSGGAIAWSVQ